MSMLTTAFVNAVRVHSRKATTYVHSVVFGRHFLLTNALISAGMGAIGDSIQQNYDILMQSFDSTKKRNRKPLTALETGTETEAHTETKTKIATAKNPSMDIDDYSFTRTAHMSAAGLTTGVVTHYWYIFLDRYLGVRRTPMILAKKILVDQIIFSPINLFVYFTTLGVCERSNWRHVRDELMQKGFENIYIAEWLIWPPMQLINFAILPLRYRILFDNVISLGFDIYSPYVKYKTELRSEKQPQPPQQQQQLESNQSIRANL